MVRAPRRGTHPVLQDQTPGYLLIPHRIPRRTVQPFSTRHRTGRTTPPLRSQALRCAPLAIAQHRSKL